MSTILYCNTKQCNWSGAPDELVCTDTDEENFSHCPYCEGEDFTEEEEDE
jgi:hypothetical protein